MANPHLYFSWPCDCCGIPFRLAPIMVTRFGFGSCRVARSVYELSPESSRERWSFFLLLPLSLSVIRLTQTRKQVFYDMDKPKPAQLVRAYSYECMCERRALHVVRMPCSIGFNLIREVAQPVYVSRESRELNPYPVCLMGGSPRIRVLEVVAPLVLRFRIEIVAIQILSCGRG
jgi:hypothetical protein